MKQLKSVRSAKNQYERSTTVSAWSSKVQVSTRPILVLPRVTHHLLRLIQLPADQLPADQRLPLRLQQHLLLLHRVLLLQTRT